jgi:hypothetical protein
MTSPSFLGLGPEKGTGYAKPASMIAVATCAVAVAFCQPALCTLGHLHIGASRFLHIRTLFGDSRWHGHCDDQHRRNDRRSTMARGSKASYTDKQKRQASKIEKSYKKRGTSSKTAAARAWATVNKETGGGKKRAAKKSSGRKSAAKKSSGRKSTAKKTGGRKKTASRKSSGRKSSARKSSGRKSASKKSASKKSASRRR